MDFKKLLPHLIAIFALAAVAAFFFAPNAFGGKVLAQPDNDKARGMQTEIQHYLEKDGAAPLWTNSAFGGMPTYQIYAPIEGNYTTYIYKAMLFWTDIMAVIWTQVFLAMFCMYLLLMALKADWRVAIFGALAFGITTYNVDILEAGHTTKMIALALAPGVLAGLVLTFNGRLMLGGGLLALFLAIQIYANHVQITYYTLIISGIYFVAKLLEAFREKNIKSWAIALSITGLALVMGFAANTSKLWPTYEYSQETIRGVSELSSKKSKGDGLDKDYLFGWSYGIEESLTLLVPHFAGGGAGESYKDTKLYNAVSPQVRSQIKGLYYTGEQSFVGTAIYFGAIIFFLFIFGAFLVPGEVKYWLLAGGLLMISIAWGKHFFLNDIFYDYLPMFKKFRAVSMALGVAQMCFALLAALSLQRVNDPSISIDQKKRALWWATGITGGICILALLLGSTSGQYDNALQQEPALLSLLQEDRASMLRSDVFRSLAFVAIAAGLLWLYLQGRLKAGLTVILITLFSLIDNWMVCSRTLSSDKYTTQQASIAPPKEEAFDSQIKQDPDPHYRVLDLARGGITGNATTSYFHKSLSGYHAAKLQRYQEVVDSFLNVNLGQNMHIVGMFNGKYIVTQQGEVSRNPEACGNAWFVNNFTILPTADAELHALGALKPKETAIVHQDYAESLKGFTIQADSTAEIRLVSYHPDVMTYEYSCATDQLAVFSEIYYPPGKGWKCFLNGQPAPDFIKADYLLRAMRLPAGQKQRLEMRFSPRSYYLGENISRIASLLILLLFAAGLYWWYRNHPISDPNRLVEAETTTEKQPRKTESRTDKTAKPKRRNK